MIRKKTPSSRKKVPAVPSFVRPEAEIFERHGPKRKTSGGGLSPNSQIVGNTYGARNLEEILNFACGDPFPYCRAEKMIGKCVCAINNRIHIEHVCACGKKFIR